MEVAGKGIHLQPGGAYDVGPWNILSRKRDARHKQAQQQYTPDSNCVDKILKINR
jgi:hypothetical protein